MIYLIILLFVVVFSLKCDFNDSHNYSSGKLQAFYFLFILFVAIAGFRYNIGGDTIGYAAKFDQYPLLKDFTAADISDIHERFQPGWVLLASICRTIVDNFLLLQFVHVLIVNIVLFRFFRKYSINYITCIALYFCVFYLIWNTEILRGSIAAVMGLLFFEAFERKKNTLAILCGIASYLFHVSGIMVLFLLLASKIKLSKKGDYVFFILCLLGSQLWAVLPSVTSFYLNSLFGEANVDPYFSQEELHNLNIFGLTIFYAKYLVLPIFVIIYHRKNVDKFKDFSVYIWLYIFLIMLSKYSIAFTRLSYFFLPFYIIGIVDAFSYLYKQGTIPKSAVILVIGLYLYIFQIQLLSPENHREELYKFQYERYYPYQSVFGDNSYK